MRCAWRHPARWPSANNNPMRAYCLLLKRCMTPVVRREGDIEALRERCKAALRAIDAERLARGQAERRAARLAHEAEGLRAPRGCCLGPEPVSWAAVGCGVTARVRPGVGHTMGMCEP